MSIAGALSFQGGVREEEVGASLARLAYTATASRQLLRGPGFVFGAVNGGCMHHGRGDTEGLFAVFDGPLFETQELRNRIGGVHAEANDAELAALAYRRWGDTFPDALDGEYAVIVWDSVRRCLLMSCDAMSRGVLHYGQANGDLLFSSEARGLVGWPGVDSSLDEITVARRFSLQQERGRTIYRGIRGVPGAATLLFRQGEAPQRVPYWFPLRRPLLQLREPEGYAEALRAAMVRAVSLRLPAEGLVASHLSSGFDSSGVTALAAQALAKQNRPLIAYTSAPVYAVDASNVVKNRFADEWPLAAKVAAMYQNVEHIRIATNGADWWDALDGLGDAFEAPQGFIRNARWYYAIHKHAQGRGVGTMLEGQAGNQTGSYTGQFGLYDLRKRGEWLALLRAMRVRRRRGEKLPRLITSAWMPRPKTLAYLRRMRGARATPSLYSNSMMRQDFYESTGLPALQESPVGSAAAMDHADGRSWRLHLLLQSELGMVNAGMRRAFDMRREDPTADRGLVELVLSIPDEAFVSNGIRRELYRIAFRHDLPTELLQERSRGLQSGDFLETFHEAVPLFLEELDRLEDTPAAVRILDLKRMRDALESWTEGANGDKNAMDRRFNYTVGGALSMGRFIRRMQV
ncbi:asparagine synthase (glutamine-hydrolyzing) [Terriglobus roseus DSM 18391]|uniref:asparagine synthase (glutamine-hydrolyzing) n=1 Tax=Terriglobus roseus (strain DSM 18391 / NRRL B-41598 / KBS 63) TaxID=926566 RepID=I3ZDW5_TERRK|nr:asparagine synthase-related protein [Terriglobus roseus]AFL87433.1 asparagine synthase (glutamine-hydrolyzing) [Terriglobus roseus DSM 18391]